MGKDRKDKPKEHKPDAGRKHSLNPQDPGKVHGRSSESIHKGMHEKKYDDIDDKNIISKGHSSKKGDLKKRKIKKPIFYGAAACIAILLIMMLFFGIKSCDGKDAEEEMAQKNAGFRSLLSEAGIDAGVQSYGKDVHVTIDVDSDETPESISQKWFLIFGTAAGTYDGSYTIVVHNRYVQGGSIDVSVKIADVNMFLDGKMAYWAFADRMIVSA